MYGGFDMVNDPIVADVYPRIGTPLHLTSSGKSVWFGKVIVSPRLGYFTKVQPSEEMANSAAKELLKFVLEKAINEQHKKM